MSPVVIKNKNKSFGFVVAFSCLEYSMGILQKVEE
jgi:hypothetical protein